MKWLSFALAFSVFFELSLANPDCNGLVRTSCRDIYTAQKCGMVLECLRLWRESYWAKYRTDVSAECTFCLHMTKRTVSERAVTFVCDIPPTISDTRSPVFDKEMCTNIATRLWSNSNGKALCNVLNHCRSHTYIGDLNFGPTLCDDCKKVLGDIRALIADNATAEAITEKLNALICSALPEQLQEFCKETVKVHVRPVLDLINRQISPSDICALLGLCPKPEDMVAQITDVLSPAFFSEEATLSIPTTHVACPKETKFSWISRPSLHGHPKWTSINNLDESALVSSDVPSGDQCEAVLNQIRQSLKDPARQAKIKEDIDKQVCSTLPSFFQTMCENAINQHFDEIMQHLDQVDLKKVCAMFGMPPSGIEITTDTHAPTLPGVCRVCQIVIARLVDMLVKNSTEREIRQALDQVCRLWPAYEKDCEQFMARYGAKIVTAIITGTAPEIVCITLGLCNPMAVTPATIPNPPPKVGDSYCETCKLLVSMVERQLLENKTKAEIEELFKGMCTYLPSSYVEECKSLIDAYLPTVLDYLTKSVSPQQICEILQLCSPSKCHYGPKYWCSSQAAAMECKAETYCKQTLGNFGAGARIVEQCSTLNLDKICENPDLLFKCGKYNECVNRRTNNYLNMVSQHTREALQKPQLQQNCTVCKQIVHLWQLHRSLFGAPYIVSNMCGMFRDEVDRNQCNLVLNKREDIFRLLSRRATDREAICKGLALCQLQTQEFSASSLVSEALPENVGAQVLACSEGPVFWCASQRNAEACGTVNFCNALSWFGEKSKSKPDSFLGMELDIFGVNVCDWGAVYWCQNEETARRCGALHHCRTVVWQNNRQAEPATSEQTDSSRPPNPCSWGPSYYCSSPEKAVQCGQKYVERCWQLAAQGNLA